MTLDVDPPSDNLGLLHHFGHSDDGNDRLRSHVDTVRRQDTTRVYLSGTVVKVSHLSLSRQVESLLVDWPSQSQLRPITEHQSLIDKRLIILLLDGCFSAFEESQGVSEI